MLVEERYRDGYTGIIYTDSTTVYYYAGRGEIQRWIYRE
jgi:hypothetical protein